MCEICENSPLSAEICTGCIEGSVPFSGRDTPYIVDLGYDIQVRYTVEQITSMYIAEGKTKAEAKKLAKRLVKGLNAIDIQEWRSWTDRWEHEVAAGLNPEVALTWKKSYRTKRRK